MTGKQKFSGTAVAVITPFHEDGRVDYSSLEKLIEKLLANGIDYLVALGTTAETPTLSKEEQIKVIETFVRVVSGRAPIIVGTGGNNTQSVVDWIAELDKYPVHGYLCVAPYYNKPNQSGLNAHFDAIAGCTKRPIILYNVPGRTASNIAAATTIRLAIKHNNVVAVKEASGSMSQIMEIVQKTPDDFTVISGDDALTLPMMAIGAKGVISVIAQAYPNEYSTMVREALNGNFAAAAEQHYQLLDITSSIYKEGNPAGIKYLLNQQGVCKNHLRLPLVPISIGLSDEIKSNMV